MSLEPAKHNFTIWQGATFRYRFTWYRDPAGLDPYDLTNYTALLEIRDKPHGTTVLLTLTTDNNSITMGAEGTIDLFISATDTANLTWRGAVYDLTVTAPGSDTSAILYGGFAVKGV